MSITETLRHHILARRSWIALQVTAALLIAIAGFGRVPTAGAQDAFCEDDPPVLVNIDGQPMIVNLTFRAYNRVDGELVDSKAMVDHLAANSTHVVTVAERRGDVYRIEIVSTVAPWAGGKVFEAYSDLTYMPTGQKGAMVSAPTPETMTAVIEIPVSSVLASGW